MHLALDSALGSGSAAIYAGDKLLAFREIPEKGAQAKLLVSTIEYVLNKAGIGYADLEYVACTVGPGGFTGIRIALATARAIGFTAQKPVMGVGTLACIAYGFGGACMAILPSGKGMVYAQRFGAHLETNAEPALFPIADLSKLTVPIITASASEIHGLDAALLAAKIEINASLVGRMLGAEHTAHLVLPPEPLYVRPPDISMPKTAAV